MLFCSLLALSLIPLFAPAQPISPSSSTTNGPLLLPSDNPNHSLDLGHIGSIIGGASAAAIVLIVIALAFAMLRWSRRQNCSYHNKELGEVVSSLPYQKRAADIETGSTDSFEDLQFPAPALLPTASHKTRIAPMIQEAQLTPPPSYSPPISNPTRPSA